MVSSMLRGEIWEVDLDSTIDSEADRPWPAVVVSNDRANAAATRLGCGVVTIVPVTAHTDEVYPFQVSLSVKSGLTVESKAHAEQVRSVAAQRLMNLIGQISPTELADLDDALRLHLGL